MSGDAQKKMIRIVSIILVIVLLGSIVVGGLAYLF